MSSESSNGSTILVSETKDPCVKANNPCDLNDPKKLCCGKLKCLSNVCSTKTCYKQQEDCSADNQIPCCDKLDCDGGKCCVGIGVKGCKKAPCCQEGQCVNDLCKPKCFKKDEACDNKYLCCKGTCKDQKCCIEIGQTCEKDYPCCDEGECKDKKCWKKTCHDINEDCTDTSMQCCMGECKDNVCCSPEGAQCSSKMQKCCDPFKCTNGKCIKVPKKFGEKCEGGDCLQGLDCQEEKCCKNLKSAECRENEECCTPKLCKFGKCCIGSECKECDEEACELDPANKKAKRECCDNAKVCSKNLKCEDPAESGADCAFDFQCKTKKCENGKCKEDENDTSCQGQDCKGKCCGKFVCYQNKCTEARKADEECEPKTCVAGMRCDKAKDGQKRCFDPKKLQNEGESCQYFENCAFGKCYDDKCMDCSEVGQPCPIKKIKYSKTVFSARKSLSPIDMLQEINKAFSEYKSDKRIPLLSFLKTQIKKECCTGLKCIIDPKSKTKKTVCSKRQDQPCQHNTAFCDDSEAKCCDGSKCCEGICKKGESCENCLKDGEKCKFSKMGYSVGKSCCDKPPDELKCVSDEKGKEFKCSKEPQPLIKKDGKCDGKILRCEEPLECMNPIGEIAQKCMDPKGYWYAKCETNDDCQFKNLCLNGFCAKLKCKTRSTKCREDDRDCCPPLSCIKDFCLKKKQDPSKPPDEEKFILRALRSRIKKFKRCKREGSLCFPEDGNCCDNLSCEFDHITGSYTCSSELRFPSLLNFYFKVIAKEVYKVRKGKSSIVNQGCAGFNEKCEFQGEFFHCCGNFVCVPEFPSGIFKCKSPLSFHTKIYSNPSAAKCVDDEALCDPSQEESTFCCNPKAFCIGDSNHGYACRDPEICEPNPFASCKDKPCCGNLKCLQSFDRKSFLCFPESSEGEACLDNRYCKKELKCKEGICLSEQSECRTFNEFCENGNCCGGLKCRKKSGTCLKIGGIPCFTNEECLSRECNKIIGICRFEK